MFITNIAPLYLFYTVLIGIDNQLSSNLLVSNPNKLWPINDAIKTTCRGQQYIATVSDLLSGREVNIYIYTCRRCEINISLMNKFKSLLLS